MPALALTDHGVMYGMIEFYQKCKKAGIKPILGVEAYIAPNDLHSKNGKLDMKPYHVILLAKNLVGYKNLIKLTSIAHLEGFYYKPRIDWETLVKHKEGIICLSACLQGEVARAVLTSPDQGEKMAQKYREVFGDDFYLEVQYHASLPEQKIVNEEIFKIAKALGIKVVATNDIHYLNKEDDDAQDVLLCLQTKAKKTDDDRMSMLGDDFSFKTPETMAEEFTDYPEAVSNTLEVAEKCNVELELEKIQLPHFEVPDGKGANDYLRELAEAGIASRYGAETPVIRERLNFELSVIERMDFASYFLIVQDFVNWAKNNGIVVGPGRGSAAGSIVSYLLNITDIDPLPYNLLFERFLNPDRISMPDIDLDFADTRRDEVIRYVAGKYGQDHVAQIITFGTMAARAAVRDVGRVLDFPYAFCDKLAKLIPMMSSLDEAMKTNSELKEIYDNDPDAKKIIDTARRLEGCARHASTHACGVLITKDPLTENVPLQYGSGSDTTIVSQYSLHPVEDLGLLKMDFLGLKNLTILESVIEIIEKIHSKKIPLGSFSLNDKKTYQLLQHGETTGVFQLESSGMKRYLKQLKPSTFEDIIAMVAMYRPGPMQFIESFINRKHGKEKISYDHPSMEAALKDTYGKIIYQEQVMRLSKDMAGFTGGQADTLRKAIGKKKADLMAKMKGEFISGCIKNGIKKELAEEVWKTWEAFAEYCFNKAHAACYAFIAYETAYFKANYPAEFMASLLTSDQGDIDRVAIEVEECERLGIEVLPPDINESFSTFTVVAESLKENKPRIRFGLLAIKNIGEGVVKAIISERRQNGKYKSFEDFLTRVKSKDLNKKSIESLAKCGAFKGMVDRNLVLENMDRILNFVKTLNDEESRAQNSLFGGITTAPIITLKLEAAPEATKKQRLMWEKELLGMYISDHPYKEFEGHLRDHTIRISRLGEYFKEGNTSVRLGGVISTVKKIFTKAGDLMLFVKIEDATGSTELLVFPNLYKSNPDLWQEEKLVVIEGRLSDKDGEVKVVVNKAAELDMANLSKIVGEYSGQIKIFNGFRNGNHNSWSKNFKKPEADSAADSPGHLVISFDDIPSAETAGGLKVACADYPGDLPVLLLIKKDGKIHRVVAPFLVGYSPELKEKIETIVGINQVSLDV